MQNYEFFILIIYVIFFFPSIYCELISKSQLDLLINSYQNNVLKNYEELLEMKDNGTVWKYNILFNLKIYSMNFDKKKIEKTIDRLKQPRENFPYKINEKKLVKEINNGELSFLNKYKEILVIIKGTNALYFKTIHMIKTVVIFLICFVLFVTLLVLGIMVYITKPKLNNYNPLNEDENKDNQTTNDNTTYKVVKILNNFRKSRKKRLNSNDYN